MKRTCTKQEMCPLSDGAGCAPGRVDSMRKTFKSISRMCVGEPRDWKGFVASERTKPTVKPNNLSDLPEHLFLKVIWTYPWQIHQQNSIKVHFLTSPTREVHVKCVFQKLWLSHKHFLKMKHDAFFRERQWFALSECFWTSTHHRNFADNWNTTVERGEPFTNYTLPS